MPLTTLAPAHRAHAAGLEVEGQQQGARTEGVRRSFASAVAAADTIPARTAAARGDGSLRRPGPGEVTRALRRWTLTQPYTSPKPSPSPVPYSCLKFDPHPLPPTMTLFGPGSRSRSDSVRMVVMLPLSPQVMCTFARNGANYVQQHWYYCYTCGLVDSRGCCGACVQACHAGHDTVYSACSNFFCDCGSGSARWASQRLNNRSLLYVDAHG